MGVTGLLVAFYQYQKGCVQVRMALLFSMVSLIFVFLVRHYVVPYIPPQLFLSFGVPLTSSFVSMLFFSLLMLLAAWAMILDKRNFTNGALTKRAVSRLPAYGIIVGIVTGFLGVGSGFILIPALLFLVRLPMQHAIGTSLLVIALNFYSGLHWILPIPYLIGLYCVL